MTPTRKLALALSLASALSAPVLPAVAGSDNKFDGNWSLSVVTEKGDCDAYTWTVVVAGNKLQRIEQLPIGASGSIDSRGQARFQVASMVTAAGQMQDTSGSGRWDAPSRSCSGRWRAARL
jgi:hypothetical protein